jgi:hypothetical protein
LGLYSIATTGAAVSFDQDFYYDYFLKPFFEQSFMQLFIAAPTFPWQERVQL